MVNEYWKLHGIPYSRRNSEDEAMKEPIDIYVLDNGKTLKISIEDFRMTLALARLHTSAVQPPSHDETIVLDRVESVLDQLEKE